MKYYATITSRSGQLEIGGTKESLTRDLQAMKRSGRLDGSESICLYGVELGTGSRVSIDADDEHDILEAAV